MRNIVVFFCICFVVLIAVLIGSSQDNRPRTAPAAAAPPIPHIGSIQVLNGCGIEGAANQVADFLRSKRFDVKNIGNAETWNYPFTMVISRTEDMSVAQQVAHSLNTSKVVLIRNDEQSYNVTVVLGPDYGDRIQ